MADAISLRDCRESDLPIFFEQQLDPDANRMAAFPARSHDEFMAHWAKIVPEQGTTIVKTIVVGENVAGYVVTWEQSAERRVGYWFGKPYWGKGIASGALAQFLCEVKVRPLYARVAKRNVASIRVLQKCGFTIDGEAVFADLDGESADELILRLDLQ